MPINPDGASKSRSRIGRRLSPLSITLIYFVVGALWILFSGWILSLLTDNPATLTRLETLKGWFYILLTAGLLYALIRRADQSLERQVEQRTQQLTTLLAVSKYVVSTLELQPLLELILDQLQSVVDYHGASISTLEEGDLALRAYRGPVSVEAVSFTRHPIVSAHHREIIATQKPAVIADTRSDDPLARAFREFSAAMLEPHYGYVASWLGAPLIAKGRVIGMLILHHTQPDYYAPPDADLVMAFASQAAVAIENARLYEQMQQRLAEIQSLQRITAALLQKLTLDQVLEIVCREARQLTGAEGAAIFSLEEESQLEVLHSAGAPKPVITHMPVEGTFTGQVVQSGESLLINDAERLAQSNHLVANLESLLVIPLCLEGAVVGALDVANKPGGFSQDDLRILSLFANEAVIAIESAWLHQQAEQLAAVEERQRLARELHDSVTQALYSVTLYAEATRMALSSGKQDVALENLKELHAMAREAMLDMRMLIFELRPPVLEEEGLVAALEARLAAVESRAGLQAEIQVEGEGRLPPATEEELFWIAMEAFNNVVKHAGAQQVIVRLRFEDQEVCLEIQDDGQGCDLAVARQGGGMGLGGMEERARRIEGELVVRSAPRQGTTVQVTARI